MFLRALIKSKIKCKSQFPKKIKNKKLVKSMKSGANKRSHNFLF